MISNLSNNPMEIKDPWQLIINHCDKADLLSLRKVSKKYYFLIGQIHPKKIDRLDKITGAVRQTIYQMDELIQLKKAIEENRHDINSKKAKNITSLENRRSHIKGYFISLIIRIQLIANFLSNFSFFKEEVFEQGKIILDIKNGDQISTNLLINLQQIISKIESLKLKKEILPDIQSIMIEAREIRKIQ